MKKAHSIVIAAGGSLFALLFLLATVVNGALDYVWKLGQAVPNTLLLPVGLLIVLAVYLAGRAVGQWVLGHGAGEKQVLAAVIGMAGVLFFLELFLCYQFYFRTGWDVDALFIGGMRLMSGGDLSTIEEYLALYPNNILLVLIESFILKVNAVLHIFPELDGLFSLVAFQCGIVSVAGVLFYDVLRRLTGRIDAALGGTALYWLFLLTSPWTAIPYTDTVGLFVPLLVLWLVLLESKKTVWTLLRWGILGAGSYLAYQLKPQLLIMTIAAVLIGLTKLIGKEPVKTAKRQAPAAGVFVLAFLLASMAVPWLERTFVPITFYDEANMIPTHYIMMGLNTERDGAYIYEDVEFSESQPNRAARKEANLRVIRERLDAMGIGGLGQHLLKKLTSCYADGTFFWSREGKDFYQVIPTERDNALSPLLRNIFIDNEEYGAYYDGWVLLRQAVWCAVLLLGVCGGFSVKRSGMDTAGIAMLYLAVAYSIPL